MRNGNWKSVVNCFSGGKLAAFLLQFVRRGSTSRVNGAALCRSAKLTTAAEGAQEKQCLSQAEASELDQTLFTEYEYSVDQLMEIAGLCVAQSVAACYPVSSACHPAVLVMCGPGNNGGDGLAAARHLHFFGYRPHLVYPKPANTVIHEILVNQCHKLQLPFLSPCPSVEHINSSYQLVIDAIFGFSYKGAIIKQPFNKLVNILKQVQVPVASVDVPSGWDVDAGDIYKVGVSPDLLISLTAPKLCSLEFKGRHHYLGLRIIPEVLMKAYNLQLPSYPGSEQIVRLI